MELFLCERMNARISRRQCDVNRLGKKGERGNPRSHDVAPCLSCAGCPGLGAATTIDVEEMAMSSKCKVKGCIKLAQHKKDGMCGVHFREKQEAMTATPKQSPTYTPEGGKDFSCSLCLTFPCSCNGTEDDRADVVPTQSCDVPAVEPAPPPHSPDIAVRAASPFEMIGFSIGSLVAEKNRAYGDSFTPSGTFLSLLYPQGIRPEQYQESLTLVRMFDKMKRIATAQDVFGEDPYQDIAGYALLAVARRRGEV